MVIIVLLHRSQGIKARDIKKNSRPFSYFSSLYLGSWLIRDCFHWIIIPHLSSELCKSFAVCQKSFAKGVWTHLPNLWSLSFSTLRFTVAACSNYFPTSLRVIPVSLTAEVLTLSAAPACSVLKSAASLRQKVFTSLVITVSLSSSPGWMFQSGMLVYIGLCHYGIVAPSRIPYNVTIKSFVLIM